MEDRDEKGINSEERKISHQCRRGLHLHAREKRRVKPFGVFPSRYLISYTRVTSMIDAPTSQQPLHQLRSITARSAICSRHLSTRRNAKPTGVNQPAAEALISSGGPEVLRFRFCRNHERLHRQLSSERLQGRRRY